MSIFTYATLKWGMERKQLRIQKIKDIYKKSSTDNHWSAGTETVSWLLCMIISDSLSSSRVRWPNSFCSSLKCAFFFQIKSSMWRRMAQTWRMEVWKSDNDDKAHQLRAYRINHLIICFFLLFIVHLTSFELIRRGFRKENDSLTSLKQNIRDETHEEYCTCSRVLAMSQMIGAARARRSQCVSRPSSVPFTNPGRTQ